jgi:hypothetical protein
MLTTKLIKPLVIAAVVLAIGGGAYGIVSATGSNGPSTTTAATSAAAAGPRGPLGGGSNARSGPAAGGAAGTVADVPTSTFTLTTSAGQQVTVDTTSSTTYTRAATSTASSAVKRGDAVLVLGTVDGTTIKAGKVILLATDGPAPATAATVVPFQRGASSTAKSVGSIPQDYTQGSGTIVSGTTANKATEAALAAYPGGIVDRVVKLGSGEYEAHNIGVSWPHHVFVNQHFKVVGAN